MTSEELSTLAIVQRSIDRLTDNLEKMNGKLDGHIEKINGKLDGHITMAATNFQEVKIDLAGVKNRFIGGWLVVGALGAVLAVIGSWIIQLHPHVQF